MAYKTNRRDFLRTAALTTLAVPSLAANAAEAPLPEAPKSSQASKQSALRPGEVERWGIYETLLTSRSRFSNPFTDVTFRAHFRCNSTELTVDGFYDGTDT